MARITCTYKEYKKIQEVLKNSDVRVIYNIVNETEEIPKDYIYDTETSAFLVFRNKYTGHEIHIEKDPEVYLSKTVGENHNG